MQYTSQTFQLYELAQSSSFGLCVAAASEGKHHQSLSEHLLYAEHCTSYKNICNTSFTYMVRKYALFMESFL